VRDVSTETREVPVSSAGYRLKRLFLGRPLATARLEHERLGKPTALAVFASDNLSSVAYATEEILRVLIPAVGLLAFNYVFGISLAIVAVEAILVFSYRQTIKAYPTAGGAYIVTRDNFGLLPAQVAGVALLTDYVLTVAVSISAGVQAISSVVEPLHAYRVPIALVLVWLVAYGNLLGVRESGRIFAFPTYLFIASLFLTIVVGLYRVAAGDLAPFDYAAREGAKPVDLGLGAITVFLVLKAFASGGAAVTGVEAISNGVPAFRKPAWRNASTTLVIMAVVLGSGFLGISYLASKLQVLPSMDEAKSVLAQLGEAIYGTGGVGRLLFLLLQLSTMLILVLAANTSFADFPRLASFHAGDAFFPRQFTKRGHRLVFSNGVIGLAVAASVLVVVFQASVTALIPLYAIGVFTSFTLSQAGMARRHIRLREQGWRHGLLINGIGAAVTAVVTVVIGVVKFSDGAWMILIAVPILVFVLVRVNRTYEREEAQLLEGIERIERSPVRRHVAVVLVDSMDEKTLHALQYALTIRPAELHPLHLSTDPATTEALVDEWERRGVPAPLEVVRCGERDRRSCLAEYVGRVAIDDVEVTVILPGPARVGAWKRLLRGRTWSGLVEPLRGLHNVSLVVVREHGGRGHPEVGGRLRISPRAEHVVLILVDRLDQSVLRGIRYARAIDASEVWALHVGVDPTRADQLLKEWAEHVTELQVPLDLVHCPDRDVARTVELYVNGLRAPDVEITVVMPRREYASIPQRFLHDRTSRTIARTLEDDPHVDVVVVPYRLGSWLSPGPPVSEGATVGSASSFDGSSPRRAR
jgi:amino acid transporter